MTRNSYGVFIEEFKDGRGSIGFGVLIDNWGEDQLSVTLPREPSYGEMRQLERAITDDKPLTLVRDIVAGWVQQLQLTGGNRSC